MSFARSASASPTLSPSPPLFPSTPSLHQSWSCPVTFCLSGRGCKHLVFLSLSASSPLRSVQPQSGGNAFQNNSAIWCSCQPHSMGWITPDMLSTGSSKVVEHPSSDVLYVWLNFRGLSSSLDYPIR